MSTTDQPTGDGAPYVQLFQKAHQKIVLLERLEEQLSQMIAKRLDLQEELRIVQRHINEELEMRINVNGENATRILNNVAGSAGPRTNGTTDKAGAPVALDRFANQTITSLAGE